MKLIQTYGHRGASVCWVLAMFLGTIQPGIALGSNDAVDLLDEARMRSEGYFHPAPIRQM